LKNPHFKFYPNDFLGGVAYLSMAERGAYITLLCYEWDAGPIPKKRLGFLLGSDWELVWDGIKSKFRENADGTISNDRLEAEREKAAQFAEKQLINGKKGGRPKPKQNPKDNPNNNPGETLLDNDNGNDNDNDKGKGKGVEKENQNFSALQPIDPELMGFKGQVRLWLETEHGYIWSKHDDWPIQELEKKIRESQQRARLPAQKSDLVLAFKKLIQNLDPWVAQNKFSLEYFNKNFNEINAKRTTDPANRNGHRINGPIPAKTVFRDGGEL